MKKGGIGGANTKTGLAFELKTDFPTFLNQQSGYSIENIDYDTRRKKGEIIKGTKLRPQPFRWRINFLGEEVGQIFQKDGLYRYFDEIEGYDYTKLVSAKLLPDEAIFVINKNTVYIVEKKTQSGGGSVDEKLQTCDFKLKQYKKLFSPLNKEVCYCYLLDKDWFKQPSYKDVLDYIISVGCKYYFNYIPLDAIGLPLPLKEE
ncbi:hypothetical protein [Streptococcus acidominimus]|uniref:Uncharacterized protein n=1 Tax=Streptococcus acidominimus TaxID=1326 RepID=A0A1Q8EC81_STRAI|nr:hypothetical protein [Streptococcus acidominimus]MBF0847641.1 hypothetical protein [Streptococcus danieliae]MBF0819045.1 hypothetical protein [Streptococcus acidominimus]MBF0837946.1 hypothetical protein [Streptococcus acidominimus]OLF49413.1 hypothetical protein BU200_07405 [Streptococcus acidominimus]TFU30456.1 hypothetical protein E4U01_06290 [Streptococcus acidominimus]